MQKKDTVGNESHIPEPRHIEMLSFSKKSRSTYLKFHLEIIRISERHTFWRVRAKKSGRGPFFRWFRSGTGWISVKGPGSSTPFPRILKFCEKLSWFMVTLPKKTLT